MKFIDEAIITVSSGDGGRGCVSFRREKYIPRGGPDGGDGGRGGDIIFRTTSRKRTLNQFRNKKLFKAENGGHGQGRQRTGKSGEDLIIDVPLGTLIRNAETDEVIRDCVTDGEMFTVATGGIGGKGNKHFTSSTHRAPRFAQPGMPGETFVLALDLKLIADVGIIGLPNAGKSTLISRISSARPKIADYPFTTLNPVLGVVSPGFGEPFVVADIPGLIEGAHLGAGLGTKFLRHIERTRILLHVIDASAIDPEDPLSSYRAINAELAGFSPSLLEKRQILVLNKLDVPDASSRADLFEQQCKSPAFRISAWTGDGIDQLVEKFTRSSRIPETPMSIDRKAYFAGMRRVVIKVGSGVLTAADGLNLSVIGALSSQISSLMEKGLEILLVSSGAMASGQKKIGLAKRPDEIPKRQAVAAVGQAGLILEYELAFAGYNRKVAQILLTSEDLAGSRRRYLNARNTLHTLLSWKVVPVINENDTVVVEEIKFGDNDNLSAMITLLMDAQLLINLTDIDGLYTKDPRQHTDAERIEEIGDISKSIEKYASDIPGALGTGGMLSKVRAARKVTSAGIPMIIANGKDLHILEKLFAGEQIGTLFKPAKEKMSNRKCWIGFTLKPKGTIRIDAGAARAIVEKGKSLLSGGIQEVAGEFGVGAPVELTDGTDARLGVGLVNYSATDIRKIMGLHTSRIAEKLGYKPYDEVIHRDNLTVFNQCL